jgi:hypothetical protein
MTNRRLNFSAVQAFCVALFVVSCGSSDKNQIPDAKAAQEAGSKQEAGAKGEAGGPLEAGGKPEAGSGKTVDVIYDGKTTAVDLSKPTPVVGTDGNSYARLSDLVLLALPGKALNTLVADFESSEATGSYKPGSKDNCKNLIPLPGEKMDKGYIHPQSRRLIWDEGLGFPGCMSVKDLAKIILVNK